MTLVYSRSLLIYILQFALFQLSDYNYTMEDHNDFQALEVSAFQH